jgi:hypothetical protein
MPFGLSEGTFDKHIQETSTVPHHSTFRSIIYFIDSGYLHNIAGEARGAMVW